MMANCADYSAMIQLYIDDELTGSEQQELLTHLETCASCRQKFEELKVFSSRIRQARPLITAPAALRERILQQTEQKKKVSSEAQPKVLSLKQSWWNSSWLPAAAAAMICVVAGAFLFAHLHRQANVSSFVDTAIVAHRSLTNASMPLDVQSDSPKVVAAWFASRVPFPFRMPNAGIASDDSAVYKLAGGRLLTFRGEQAALLAFQMQNDTISVLIASGNKAKAEGGKITYSNDIRFHSADRNDLHVVTWENKQLVYALIFPNKVAAERTCSTCHTGSRQPKTALLDKPHWLAQ
ncbi:MAG TPA: zf-HC2 domain-containing protein [Pseudacidobacterium sp.]|nr:zf-HC2 domain-containing protein [Pseudacidobacterium sp.]